MSFLLIRIILIIIIDIDYFCKRMQSVKLYFKFIAGMNILAFVACSSLPKNTILNFDLAGRWVSSNSDSVFEFYKQANGKYQANLLSLKKPLDENGQAWICSNCSGTNKNKPIIGMTVIWDLIPEEGQYIDGKILVPRSGKIYGVKVYPVNPDKISVRGYIGFGLIGKTIYWTRSDQLFTEEVNELATTHVQTAPRVHHIGVVHSIAGKKVTVLAKNPAKIRPGVPVYFLNNKGVQVGNGRIQNVFHTKIIVVLKKGSANKNNIGIFYLKK